MLSNPLDKMPMLSPEKGSEKLKNYLQRTSQKLREIGFPVTEDCQVNIEEFKGILYSPGKVEDDKEWIKQRKDKNREYQFKPDRIKNIGKQLEFYATAMLNKYLGKDFFVVRLSEIDDFKNRVDILIIDKKIKDIACAFDVTIKWKGPKYEEKVNKILARNLGPSMVENEVRRKTEGGAKIRYGLEVKKEEGETKIKLAELKNIPIFYLALSVDEVERGITEFTPLLEESSEYERKMFEYFVDSLKSQISPLGLRERELNPKLKRRLKSFEEKLNKWNIRLMLKL